MKQRIPVIAYLFAGVLGGSAILAAVMQATAKPPVPTITAEPLRAIPAPKPKPEPLPPLPCGMPKGLVAMWHEHLPDGGCRGPGCTAGDCESRGSR